MIIQCTKSVEQKLTGTTAPLYLGRPREQNAAVLRAMRDPTFRACAAGTGEFIHGSHHHDISPAPSGRAVIYASTEVDEPIVEGQTKPLDHEIVREAENASLDG